MDSAGLLDRAKSLIRKHEGEEEYAYWDTANPPKRTVGRGFNMDAPMARYTFTACCPESNFDDVYKGKKALTPAEIDALFVYTFNRAMFSARGLVSGYDSLPVDAQAVVIDMIFNLGAGGFGAFNKLRLALSKQDYAKAADEMVDSLWYRQTKSRAEEDVAIIRSLA
jgi:GH24 family phage-related lysozyme (muramidase)